VTGVEGLGDVGRGELDNDLLLTLGRVRGVLETHVAIGTEGSLLGQDTAQNSVGQRGSLAEELQVRAEGSGRVNEVGLGEFGGQLRGELIGLLLDTEGSDLEVEHKAGKSVVLFVLY
jgi:hypothetical protein